MVRRHSAFQKNSDIPYQARPGARVVTSWTSHVLPSGSLKDKNDRSCALRVGPGCRASRGTGAVPHVNWRRCRGR